MAEDAPRISAEALADAVASFAALADAYAKSDDAELAGDREAAEVVRDVVASLATFARGRRVRDEARARTVLANALRAVYDRVSSGDEGAENEPPPSRRTWHEGAWRTAAERRGVVARMITRCVPALAHDESLVAVADLSREQIEAHGGPRKAAEAVVATVFARRPADDGRVTLAGATVFGLPLP